MTSTHGAPVTEREHIERKAPSPSAIRAESVTHGFGELEVLNEIELEVAEGEVVGVVGPSGCGKSTLLELISGLSDPVAGEIEVEGANDPAARLASCAYMPQRDLLFPWLSAIDNAAIAPRNRGASKRAAREEALPLFARFGLADFADSQPGELSGGMRQRVAFLARSLPVSRSCCSTSRSPRSTRSRAARCRSGLQARSSESRARLFWSRTTSRRRCICAIAWPCSPRGRLGSWPSSDRRRRERSTGRPP